MDEYQSLFEGGDSLFKVTDEEEVEGQERSLQSIDWQRQSVTLGGVGFAGNRQGKHGGEEKYGMVTIEYSYDDFEITNCHFHDNDFGDPLDAVSPVAQC